MNTVMIFTTLVFFILEFYAFQAVRLLTSHLIIRVSYWGITLMAYGAVLYVLNANPRPPHGQVNIAITLFLTLILSKIFIVLFLFIEDFMRGLQFLFRKMRGEQAYMPARKKFFSTVGMGFFAFTALLFLDGVFFGKFRHTVRRVKLKLEGLPVAFNGYKIIQISDLHSGSFPNAKKLQFTIDMINAENPDLVLFTGDAVNSYADEFIPFIPLFKAIKAKDGKFSVLGNHDYAMYGNFPNEKAKQKNIDDLIRYFQSADFRMLRNDSVRIQKNDEEIALLGVENWGLPPFPQYGDLDKALNGVAPDLIKILMSHDPTHFDSVVKQHSQKIHLTLSGHTHGMQFGLDLKNIRWSPVQYKYKKWADLYESQGQYLYVNRGFGVIGYPGRVGIKPEITLFTLEG